MELTKRNIYCNICQKTTLCYKCQDQLTVKWDLVIDGERFEVFICSECGTGIEDPMPTDEFLNSFYAKNYRKSEYGICLNGTYLDTPIQIPWIGIALKRFETFYNVIQKSQISIQGKFLIEYGAYSGIFLDAANKVFESRTLGIDLNPDGKDFAKKVYDINIIIDDIYSYTPSEKASVVCLIHVFEHLKKPTEFLRHVKNHVLEDNGLIYLEVPNFFGYGFSFVHHFHYCISTLTFLLKKEGYEVLDCFVTGKPTIPHFSSVGENHPSWLVCLAQKKSSSINNCQKPSASSIYSEFHSSMASLDLKRMKLSKFDSFKYKIKHAIKTKSYLNLIK
jgi:hypothetical protein